jgi:hypothetical protein
MIHLLLARTGRASLEQLIMARFPPAAGRR